MQYQCFYNVLLQVLYNYCSWFTYFLLCFRLYCIWSVLYAVNDCSVWPHTLTPSPWSLVEQVEGKSRGLTVLLTVVWEAKLLEIPWWANPQVKYILTEAALVLPDNERIMISPSFRGCAAWWDVCELGGGGGGKDKWCMLCELCVVCWVAVCHLCLNQTWLLEFWLIAECIFLFSQTCFPRSFKIYFISIFKDLS